MPSMKLKALVTATTQSTVTRAPRTGPRSTPPANGRLTMPMRKPSAQRSTAAAVWTPNLVRARTPRRSSASPSANTTSAGRRIRPIFGTMSVKIRVTTLS